MIERMYEGESAAFPFRIRNPSWLPIVQLSETIRNAKTAPIEEMTDFVRVVRISALPWPLRRLLWWIAHSFGRLRASYFGTFIVSVYSSLGADPLYGISPGTALLTYGVIASDGEADVRIMWDHRVLDGAVIARACANGRGALHGNSARAWIVTTTNDRHRQRFRCCGVIGAVSALEHSDMPLIPRKALPRDILESILASLCWVRNFWSCRIEPVLRENPVKKRAGCFEIEKRIDADGQPGRIDRVVFTEGESGDASVRGDIRVLLT
jgi:hypothetical protein